MPRVKLPDVDHQSRKHDLSRPFWPEPANALYLGGHVEACLGLNSVWHARFDHYLERSSPLRQGFVFILVASGEGWARIPSTNRYLKHLSGPERRWPHPVCHGGQLLLQRYAVGDLDPLIQQCGAALTLQLLAWTTEDGA